LTRARGSHRAHVALLSAGSVAGVVVFRSMSLSAIAGG
jgi:hypothetical protein